MSSLLQIAEFKLENKFKQQPLPQLQDFYTVNLTLFCWFKYLMKWNESLFVRVLFLPSTIIVLLSMHSVCIIV